MSSEASRDPVVVRISPELVRPSMSEALRGALEPYLQEEGTPEGASPSYQLDLTQIEYLGSSAIAILLTFLRRARERGASTEVLVSSRDVVRTLRLTRIDRLVPLREVPPGEGPGGG